MEVHTGESSHLSVKMAGKNGENGGKSVSTEYLPLNLNTSISFIPYADEADSSHH